MPEPANVDEHQEEAPLKWARAGYTATIANYTSIAPCAKPDPPIPKCSARSAMLRGMRGEPMTVKIKRYAVTAYAAGHNGQRTFVVRAKDMLEASKLAERMAPSAWRRTVRELA